MKRIDLKKNPEVESTIHKIWFSGAIIAIILVTIAIKFGIPNGIMIGICVMCLGIVQFTLKDKIYIIHPVVWKTKPLYVRIVGSLLIFFGLFFIYLEII